MSRFTLEPATKQHEPALRRLFAQSEMDGDIRISFRREPDYFIAANLFGPHCQVIAARDSSSGEVLGVGTRAVRPGFINGRMEPIGYLADLRLDPRYRGGLLIARAYRRLKELHGDRRTKIYFTVIAEGNRPALDTIASGRAGLPPYRDCGRILSPAINLLGRRSMINAGVEIRRGTRPLISGIIDCLSRNHRRRQFAPYFTMDHFLDSPAVERACSPRLRDFEIEDFYVALRGDRVVGVLGKWDQNRFKQTVVTGYKGRLKLLRPLYNPVAALLGGPRYPAPGESLRSFYASFIAIDDDNVEVFRALLRQLYNDHVGAGYHYFLVGLHEKDQLCAALADYSLTPFTARLFAVHFEDGARLFETLDGRTPYVELALL